VYALSSGEAKVVVLDAATGRIVKVLENLGGYPHILLAVPQLQN
jgi:hypothetical protein